MQMFFDVAKPSIAKLKNMFPFLSVDNLVSGPMRPLSLLHVLAEYGAGAWAAVDFEKTRGGWHRGALDSGFSRLLR